MTPTIVAHEGRIGDGCWGHSGSSKIITTVANVLIGVIDYVGMNIQEAANAPRFHNQCGCPMS